MHFLSINLLFMNELCYSQNPKKWFKLNGIMISGLFVTCDEKGKECDWFHNL